MQHTFLAMKHNVPQHDNVGVGLFHVKAQLAKDLNLPQDSFGKLHAQNVGAGMHGTCVTQIKTGTAALSTFQSVGRQKQVQQTIRSRLQEHPTPT